jgi:hypothetical protein
MLPANLITVLSRVERVDHPTTVLTGWIDAFGGQVGLNGAQGPGESVQVTGRPRYRIQYLAAGRACGCGSQERDSKVRCRPGVPRKD